MRIEWQIKLEDPRFLEVVVDGEVWREVHKASFARKLSALKGCQSESELKEAFFKLECKVAELCALRLLTKRDYFTTELRSKLTERRLSTKAIECALEKCVECGYLSDERLTERYIASLKRKGKGPRYIAQKVKERLGFFPSLPRDESGDREAIAELLAKRFPHLDRGDEREKARAVRFLQARGFEMDLIWEAVKTLDKSPSI